jgi:hypothetical protein
MLIAPLRAHHLFVAMATVLLAAGFATADLVLPTPPVELGGKRGLCFRNSCSQTLWAGQIGAATGLPCDGGCPAGTICHADPTKGCYFSLQFPGGKIRLPPRALYCLPFSFAPVMTRVFMPTETIELEVQWSGAIYASTHCDNSLDCRTAICKDCPSYKGPVGPVSQAEMTLAPHFKDFYDTTLIHGANVPLAIKPVSVTGRSFPDPLKHPAYHCQSPGQTVSTDPNVTAATWAFNTAALERQHLSVVPLVAAGSGSACTNTTQCPAGEQCGGRLGLNELNLPLPDLIDGVCGEPVGVWSRSEMCGWTDATGFANCKDNVTGGGTGGGTVQELFKCSGPYAGSCFTDGAKEDCCGCATWDSFVPVHSDACKNTNPLWRYFVEPNLERIKRACPTCYTYPYDDSTALYTCWNGAVDNNVSYEMEWCPNGVEMTYTNSDVVFDTPTPLTTGVPSTTVEAPTTTVEPPTTVAPPTTNVSNTSVPPSTSTPAPSQAPGTVVLQIKIQGSSFAELLAQLDLRQLLIVALIDDLAVVLSLDPAVIQVGDLQLGSLIVTYKIQSTPASTSDDRSAYLTVLNSRGAEEASATFFSGTQVVYATHTSGGANGEILVFAGVVGVAPSTDGPTSSAGIGWLQKQEESGCDTTCIAVVVISIVGALTFISIIAGCICLFKSASPQKQKRSPDGVVDVEPRQSAPVLMTDDDYSGSRDPLTGKRQTLVYVNVPSIAAHSGDASAAAGSEEPFASDGYVEPAQPQAAGGYGHYYGDEYDESAYSDPYAGSAASPHPQYY